MGVKLVLNWFSNIFSKGTTDEVQEQQYHRVMIFKDNRLMNLGKQLKKLDLVYLRGFINYVTKEYEDEGKHTSGFIQPTNLIKIKRFK